MLQYVGRLTHLLVLGFSTSANEGQVSNVYQRTYMRERGGLKMATVHPGENLENLNI